MKTYSPLLGESINETARKMVELADIANEQISAEFNEITLVANPGDIAKSIVDYYHQETRSRHEKWLNSPEGQLATQKAEERDQKIREEMSKPLPTFALRDPDGWKKTIDANKDSYGSGVVRFAARWANLMEERIATGAKLEDIADETSHEADIEGITGFMYGAAVSMLSQVWEYGEQLRKWHNLDTQIGNEGEKANEEGGVLNPALLSFGKK